MPDNELGHVIYAIGLTADFRNRLFETVEAHICLLARLLQNVQYDSFLYLSSTRVYAGLPSELAMEETPLVVMPDADGIYNLTKLTGEAVCLSQLSLKIRVARLANVYGNGQSKVTFLGSLFDDLAHGRDPHICEAPTSSKDYIAIDDVCWLLERIALGGQHRNYNIASGESLCHEDLARALERLSSRRVTFADGALHRSYPRIDIARITREFGFRPRRLMNELSCMLNSSITCTP